MGRAFVLLLVGVMEAAVHRLQPNNIPKAFQRTDSTGQLGTAYPEETYPISEWSMSLWMFTNNANGESLYFPNTWVALTWYGTSFSFYDGVNFKQLTTSESINGKWVFLQLGSTTAISYGVGTSRKGTQYFLSSTTTLQLLSTSSLEFFGTCFMSVITI